jgi:hypothetical protein
MAFACSLGSGNIVTIIPSTTAELIAPPTPWMNRAPMIIPCVCETAQNTEASVKIVRPIRKILRWPTRSPRRPESSSRPPKAIR